MAHDSKRDDTKKQVTHPDGTRTRTTTRGQARITESGRLEPARVALKLDGARPDLPKASTSSGLATRNMKAAVAVWGSRENSHKGNEIQVRAMVNELVPVVRGLKKVGGMNAHHIGSRLAWLFHVHADAIYGKADFLSFAREVLGLGRTQAYRYARIARFATESQAEWGEDEVLVAASIVELVAGRPDLQRKFALAQPPRTITDLARVELPLPGGRHLKLAGEFVSLTDLEGAYVQLGGAVNTPLASKLSAADREAAAKLERATTSDPRLSGVDVRVSRGNSGVRLLVKLPAGRSLAAVSSAIADALKGD